MVDAASPTHPGPEGFARTTSDREASPLRLRRWISAGPPVEAPTRSRGTTVLQILLVVALGASLRLYRIGAQPLWVDEATSLRFARGALSQLWS